MLVNKLRDEGHGPAVNPTLPLDLELARREVNAAFNAFERDPEFLGRAKDDGLLAAMLRRLGSHF
jgi:hypothetical protein